MTIHLLTPKGLFRRVEDNWSPRREIVLDKDARMARDRQQASSPVKLPTHEILSHALVYHLKTIHEDSESSELMPSGCAVLYEWLGTVDGYTELAQYFALIQRQDGEAYWSTDYVLKSDAQVALNLRYEALTEMAVTYAGPAFQE